MAWRQAVDVLGPALRGYVAVRGADDPDEVLANVYLHLAGGIDRFDGDWNSFRTLAFVIARRRVVDSIRYNVRRPSEPWTAESLDARSVGGDVEQEAMANLDRERVLELLHVLTPIQQDVLTMRLVAGLTTREIATITDTSVTAVKANQRRAVASLRRHLNQPRTGHGPSIATASPTRIGLTR